MQQFAYATITHYLDDDDDEIKGCFRNGILAEGGPTGFGIVISFGLLVLRGKRDAGGKTWNWYAFDKNICAMNHDVWLIFGNIICGPCDVWFMPTRIRYIGLL